jgi:hypothetical protein
MGMEDLKKLREKDCNVGAQSTGTAPVAPQATEMRAPRRRSNRPLFSETHVRFTNYLEKEIADRIEELRKAGRLDRSMTRIINESVRKYLDTYY